MVPFACRRLPILVVLLLALSAAAPLLGPTTLAQSGVALTARYAEEYWVPSFHSGANSEVRLAVVFSQDVAHFDVDTPSALVNGGELFRVYNFDVTHPDGGAQEILFFFLRASGAGTMTFSLLPGQPCGKGGICATDGTPLTEVPESHAIPGSVAVSFDDANYVAADSIPGDVAVSLSFDPGRSVVVPLLITYGDGVRPPDVIGIPDNIVFGLGETLQVFQVALADGAIDANGKSIVISFGELPDGTRAGDRTSVGVSLHDREIWSAEMTVGTSEGYLGYGTFAETDAGSLTGSEFTWHGMTHTVTNLLLDENGGSGPNIVSLEVSPGIAKDADCLYIALGDVELNLADGYINERQFFWRAEDLEWTEGDAIDVGLRQFSPWFPARSLDGRGNNHDHADWGQTDQPLRRFATVSYMDRVAEAPTWLPNPRLISNILQQQDAPTANTALASDMMWQWGQFLDHDISHTPPGDPNERLDIAVPAGDTVFDPEGGIGLLSIAFTRSLFDPATGTGPDNPREQVNAITAFIDASQVYGSDVDRSLALRTNDGTGQLRTSAEGRLLMYNTPGLENDGGSGRADLFLSGDVRSNEQVGLLVMHTLFVREHNRLSAEIGARYPDLTGNEIYEMARKIVGAQMQAITYNEFLPQLLGQNAIGSYRGYDASVDPRIANEFSTAAFRVGHTMLPASLLRMDSDGNRIEVPLTTAFFNPALLAEVGIPEFLRGLMVRPAEEIDLMVISEVRNLLFAEAGAAGIDLAALNIQRGRDHGIASYNAVRKAYGLHLAVAFSDVSEDPTVVQSLGEVYSDVSDVDLWIGGLAEDHVPGAMVGETFHAIITDQFRRLRDGDRFWFEGDPFFLAHPELLGDIRETTLAEVIQRNTLIGDEIPDNVFVVAVP